MQILIIAYQGTLATEAIAAAGMLGGLRRDIGVLSLTSADRLNAGWQAAQRARSRGASDATSHIERMLNPLPRHCKIITIIDGHPATLSWLGGVAVIKPLVLVLSILAKPEQLPIFIVIMVSTQRV